MQVILGRNEDMGEDDVLLAEGCRVEGKGGTTPGDVECLALGSWNELCFCVCKPVGAEDVC